MNRFFAGLVLWLVFFGGWVLWSQWPPEKPFLEGATSFQRGPASSDRMLAALAKPSKWFGEGTFVPAPVISKDEEYKFNQQSSWSLIPMDLSVDPNLPPGEKSTLVVHRIADHSLSAYFNSADFRKSSLGRVATEVEKKANQEIVLQGASKDSREHKINFQIQAFQTTAKVEYIGFAKFSVSYNFRQSLADAEVSESLSPRQTVSLGHSRAPSEARSSVRWNWSF